MIYVLSVAGQLITSASVAFAIDTAYANGLSIAPHRPAKETNFWQRRPRHMAISNDRHEANTASIGHVLIDW